MRMFTLITASGKPAFETSLCEFCQGYEEFRLWAAGMAATTNQSAKGMPDPILTDRFHEVEDDAAICGVCGNEGDTDPSDAKVVRPMTPDEIDKADAADLAEGIPPEDENAGDVGES